MRYNSYKKKYITLKEGEYFCKTCDGAGVVIRSNSTNKKVGKLTCHKCLGEGKLDWVEKAVGKQPKRRNLKVRWTV